MNYTIYIILTLIVIWIIFSKKIDDYLGEKLKSLLNIDEEFLNKKKEENNQFQRDELSNSTQNETFINSENKAISVFLLNQ